jgi:RHS repeat-associated protein/uncharacterized repeat protein (TIGR01451 family)
LRQPTNKPSHNTARFALLSLLLNSIRTYFIFAFVQPLSKGRKHRALFKFTLFTITSLLLPLFSFSPNLSARTVAATLEEVIPPPAPEVHRVLPMTDPHLPTLSAHMEVTPHMVAVGDAFTLTLTVINSAPDAASNLVATLPLPQGVTRIGSSDPEILQGKSPGTLPSNAPGNLPASATVPASYPSPSTTSSASPSASASPRPTDDWNWQIPTLNGNGGTATFVASARLTQPPAGDAIIARAQVIANGLSIPIVSEGGALFLSPNRGPANAQFNPGNAATLHSQDGRTHVQVPSNAYSQTLTVQHTFQQTPGRTAPPDMAGRKNGLGTFYLNASDAQGREVHRFSAPLTVTVDYTPQQLQASGISEDDLTLFWYDDTQPEDAHWVPIDSRVESAAHTITARVSHFSAFQLSDGSSPSAAFIPSLQGWQVGLYQGDVSYQYPIEVPAGPAGIKPSLALSYNSASTDGATGRRPLQQAGWAGKGWSLDTGYVALNKLPGQGKHSRYYSLVFDGQSFEVVRGAARVSSPNLENPTHWEWRSTNESFIRVRAESNGYSDSTRGGLYTPAGTGPNGQLPRFKWQVWTKNGTRFDFEEDAWQAFISPVTCNDPDYNFMETYKWYLTRVEDTHGNRINYTYDREKVFRDQCGPVGQPTGATHIMGTVDGSVWPTQITWGGNATASDRYKVEFESAARTIDTGRDQADGQLGPVPGESRQLLNIKVMSMQATSWELVRQYNLGYETNSANYMLSDATRPNDPPGTCPNSEAYCSDPNYPKLTLKQIQRIGNDGSIALPATTFTYGLTRGANRDPNPAWNRLTSVNNGQGGTITFGYESISASQRSQYGDGWGTDLFLNNRRVTSKTVNDGQGQTWGHSYVWTYSYPITAYNVTAPPAYNSLGTDMNASGPNANPNSAALYINKKYDRDPKNDHSSELVSKKETQFRGHAYVIEHDPNGNETEHWFYQGNGFDQYGAACTPDLDLYENDIYDDPCFQSMRKHEFLKGREYKTIAHASTVSGDKLSEVNHIFDYTFISEGVDQYADDSYSGLWRAFSWESQTVEKAWEGASTPIEKTTNYTYEGTYGNLTLVEEIAGSVTRRTGHGYGSYVTASKYIVDRPLYDNVKDGQNKWLARTVYSYDGSWGEGAPTSNGDLTLVRKYYNIPINPPSTTLPTAGYSSDTSYAYDSYGNQTGVTTYAGPGLTGTFNGTPNYGIPGGSYAARTTTTTYDTTFHAFPIVAAPPTVNSVTLTETVGYDYRMGTLTSVVGPNGSATTVSAEYDEFGRMSSLIKPGDASGSPTLDAVYYDYAIPFNYVVMQYETTGYSNYRPTTKFYDGLGRLIQTKAESKDIEENIVTDTQYDGLGQATHESQPRYVSNTKNSPVFWNYVPIANQNILWTVTDYDALGRPTSILEPDNTSTLIGYTLYNGRRAVTTTDAKGHKTRRTSDMLGRLLGVAEYQEEWGAATFYSGTEYAYNPLDLLETVTDGYSKNITMQYDSLGRKTGMTDLAMGTWSYQYDVNGNLTQQTDARSQVITFTYDALNRLTSKSWPSYGSNPAESLVYNYDQTGTGYANGKGQRTSTTRCTGVANTTCTGGTQTSLVQWQYDTRGQNTSTTYTLNGLTGARAMSQAYDRGGRLISMTYPTGEAVSYTYDPAWRQVSLYSSSTYSLNYANNATYTALDQPSNFTLGNGLSQTYGYTSLMQRLSSIQVGSGGSIFNRGYTYDEVGNVATITGSPTIGTQTFTYDHRDRLTNWTATGINESYQYDLVGNITSKAGVSNTYTYTQSAGAGGPYAIRNTDYSYDNNGNMTTMPTNSKTLVWNTENQPVSITSSGTTETYTYDADGARIKKLRGTTNTFYIGGLAEEDKPTGAGSTVTRSMYTFNGQVIAQRTVTSGGFGSDTLIYLHSDHLGSVGAATTSAGGSLSSQEYDPWGKVRTGAVTQTKYNYTGQKLDDTGLLLYNARYYDPGLGRFTSPDSIVPAGRARCGCGAESIGAEQNSKLTVDFHESRFLSTLHRENGQILSEGFWFQLSRKSRSQTAIPWGPGNPQSIGRYSYTLNNPLRYVDPTGHARMELCPATQSRYNGKRYVDAVPLYFQQQGKGSYWIAVQADNPGGPEIHVYVKAGSGCLEEIGIYDPRYPSNWSTKHGHTGEVPVGLGEGVSKDIEKKWNDRFGPVVNTGVGPPPGVPDWLWWLVGGSAGVAFLRAAMGSFICAAPNGVCMR